MTSPVAKSIVSPTASIASGSRLGQAMPDALSRAQFSQDHDKPLLLPLRNYQKHCHPRNSASSISSSSLLFLLTAPPIVCFPSSHPSFSSPPDRSIISCRDPEVT
ncbi:hypothetical protein NW756_002040 [Fusarium oxysporum]|nr:hypothetical protein NW753_000593 [Fusarium oxysporum]KAJ4071040.1 hypothetical protein NW763_000052 [Fusarium oxysporum]KAJ4101617.1 hypothetical protein NW756_002040 [Fusarium oxysporum]KAJ4117968.1 hypothetical protein NW769_002759 [Fusarium oxysporum]KAJ4241858.1 hypothetical protein NW760_000069 [Fusarium oxysporum]